MNRSRANCCVRSVRIAVFACLTSAGALAQAETVSYTLQDIFLQDGSHMTGAFDWTFATSDFEDGTGVFTALTIPWRPSGSLPPLEDPDMVLTIENNQIEISLDGNFHDYGLDVTLKFVAPLSPDQSSSIDLATSFFECCGNGFRDQPFISGSIAPVLDSDSDGVGDDADNCLTVSNTDQRDTNSDGFGNRCDADFNNDCVVNVVDLGVLRGNFFATDPDTDLNGDGVVNVVDLGILRALFFNPPGPSGTTICES